MVPKLEELRSAAILFQEPGHCPVHKGAVDLYEILQNLGSSNVDSSRFHSGEPAPRIFGAAEAIENHRLSYVKSCAKLEWQRLDDYSRIALITASLEAGGWNEPVWQCFFQQCLFNPFQAQLNTANDNRSFPSAVLSYFIFDSDQKNEWTACQSIRKENSRCATFSTPRPDLSMYFSMLTAEEESQEHYLKSVPSFRNFTVETLMSLTISGLTPSVYKHKKGIPEEARRRCYPFFAGELKRPKASKSKVYCQAANAASVILTMYENAARYAPRKKLQQHIPPVPVMTAVGPEVKIYVAYSTIDKNGTGCNLFLAWKGNLTRAADVAKFQVILKSIHTWAMQVLRPELSHIIGQWLDRHLLQTEENQAAKQIQITDCINRIHNCSAFSELLLELLGLSTSSTKAVVIRKLHSLIAMSKHKSRKPEPTSKPALLTAIVRSLPAETQKSTASKCKPPEQFKTAAKTEENGTAETVSAHALHTSSATTQDSDHDSYAKKASDGSRFSQDLEIESRLPTVSEVRRCATEEVSTIRNRNTPNGVTDGISSSAFDLKGPLNCGGSKVASPQPLDEELFQVLSPEARSFFREPDQKRSSTTPTLRKLKLSQSNVGNGTAGQSTKRHSDLWAPPVTMIKNILPKPNFQARHNTAHSVSVTDTTYHSTLTNTLDKLADDLRELMLNGAARDLVQDRPLSQNRIFIPDDVKQNIACPPQPLPRPPFLFGAAIKASPMKYSSAPFPRADNNQSKLSNPEVAQPQSKSPKNFVRRVKHSVNSQGKDIITPMRLVKSLISPNQTRGVPGPWAR